MHVMINLGVANVWSIRRKTSNIALLWNTTRIFQSGHAMQHFVFHYKIYVGFPRVPGWW